MSRDVWITAFGMVSAVGSGPQAHRAAACAGRSGLARHVFFDNRPPDPVVAGRIPADIVPPDLDGTAATRANLVLEHMVRQALTAAGNLDLSELDLVVGTTLGNLHGGTCYYRALRAGMEPDVGLVRHFLPCAPASHVQRMLGIGGRNWTIASACGSGTAALGFAYNRIRQGLSNAFLAAGLDVLSPYVVAGFNSLRLVSSRECRPFDKDRDGLNPGEGGAAFILESAESASRRGARPLAVVEGFGEGLDAYHHTRSHPEGAALVTAIRKALRCCALDPTAIDHVHLHGTGTQANDISEYHACRTVFGARLPDIPVCSTKSMTGHTFGGAGALSAAFCLLTLIHGVIPPTLFLETRDPGFEGFAVSPTARQGVKARHVLSIALGFGGEAFALVLGQP